MMQAIFVTQVRGDQDMAKLFKKARPFAINGPTVAKWARWLSQVRQRNVQDKDMNAMTFN